MICIKMKKFSNKIGVSTKTIGANRKHVIPVGSHQNSMNDQNEVPNLEISNNIECQSSFQTNSSESSLEDFMQDQTISIEDQEVIQISL